MLILVLAIGLALAFNTALEWAIEQARWYRQIRSYRDEVNVPYRPYRPDR